MSKRQFDKVDRRPVLKADFEDTMKQRLLAPKGEIKSETRTPSKAELALNWAVMLLVLATACVPAGAQTIGDSLVVSSSRVTVAENGDTATYTVKLSAEPGRVIAVRLEPAPAPPGLITVRPHQMLFDRRNWNIPQTVTVTGVDNDDFGDRMVTVTHTASGGKGAASVEVTIKDDELPPLPTVSLSVAPNPVVEGGSVTVTGHLSSALPSSVTIPLVLTAGTAEAGDYGALAGIAIAAGQTAATGTIGTVEDADRDDETFTVSLGMLPALVTAGSPSSVEVTIEDDDTAGSPSSVEVMIKDDDMAGIGLSPPSLHIRGCGTAAYTILLLSQPKAEVTVTVESDAPDVATTSPARLVFTPENWNRGRKVTVTTRIGGIASIVHRASSSDPGYDAASLTRTLRVVVGEGAPTLFAAPWQARFGRSHATQVLEGIAGRIAAQPKAGVDGSRSIAAHREVTSSSFALTGEEVLDGSMQSVWGRSSGLHFRGRERALVLDGEVRTATVGADRWRGQSQMGLALSRGLGKGEYGGGCSGRIRASLTSVVPYASLQALERLKLWGALGYGTGKVTFRPKVGDRYKADLTWTMAVAGLRGQRATFAGGRLRPCPCGDFGRVVDADDLGEDGRSCGVGLRRDPAPVQAGGELARHAR
ncbi:MAG: hypothetical protein F4Y53_00985 [Proteobacteria bacterium]|nr:hypothetical protein [Pseudomonadota bacterium]